MINRALKILILEDLKTDQTLIKRQVLKIAPHAIFVSTNSKQSFLEQVNWANFDVVLSDYNLPSYTGEEALEVVKEKMPHVPFIYITGTLNDEEKAANAILRGASGYILKNKLNDLPTKLENILNRSFAAFEREEKMRRAKAHKNRLLQKLAAKIGHLPTSDEKQELEQLVKELLETPVAVV